MISCGTNGHAPRAFVLSLSAALVLQATMPQDARAAETPGAPAESSADLFKKGLAEYDAQRYGRAIEIFSRVYDETRAPALLFNIGQAWRLHGNCPKAVATYEAFIVADPTSPDVGRARGWLEKLRSCQQPTAEVKPLAPPAAKSVPPPAGAPVAISVRPTAPSPSPETPPRSRPLVVGGLVGASVIFAGAGVYAAWRANDFAKQVSASYGNGGTWNPEAATLDREGNRAQVEAVALVTAAVLSGVAAYVVHRVWSTP